MATEAQLFDALRRADKAGATEDAKRFAQMIQDGRKASANSLRTSFDAGAGQAMTKAGTPEDYAAGLGANVAQGLTGGFADEAAGVARSLGPGFAGLATGVPLAIAGADAAMPGYAEGRDQFRQVRSDFADRNPVAATLGQLAGAIPTVIGAPGSAAARGLTNTQRLARAATIGGGYGAVAGAGEGEGGPQGRLASAGMGTLAGAAGGALLETLSPIAGRLLGIGERGAPPPIRAQADSLPVPVPMTVGQATDNVGQLAREFALYRGTDGPGAQGVMRDFGQRQQEALQANRDPFLERLASGGGRNSPGPVINRGEGGAMVSDRLSAMEGAARTDASGRYAALDAAGYSAGLPGIELSTNIGRAVAAHHDLLAIPNVARELDRLQTSAVSGEIPVKTLVDMRQRLSGLRTGNTPESVAAGRAVNAIDQEVTRAIDGSLLRGDPNAVTLWRDAMANYRNFASTYKSKDLVGALVKRDPGQGFALVNKPEETANYIFGRSALNLGRRDLQSGLEKMRGLLGESSPEWNALRQEAFLRHWDQAFTQSTPGAVVMSGAAGRKAWEKLAREGGGVLRVLFSDAERRDIGNFWNVAARVTARDPAVYAPSVSATMMRRISGYADKILGRIPGVGPVVEGLRIAAREGAARAAAERATSGVLPATYSSVGAVPAAAGVAAGQAPYIRSTRQNP